MKKVSLETVRPHKGIEIDAILPDGHHFMFGVVIDENSMMHIVTSPHWYLPKHVHKSLIAIAQHSEPAEYEKE